MFYEMQYKDVQYSKGTKKSCAVPYLIEMGSGDIPGFDLYGNVLTWEAYILAYLEYVMPLIYDGMYRTTIVIGDRVNQLLWRATVNYEARESSHCFDFTGGTMNVKSAITHVADYAPPGGDLISHNGLINVDDDGVPAGVDIESPRAEFSETHFLTDAQISVPYQLLLEAMSPSVNSDTFRGRDPGSVKFLGAMGGRKDNDVWEVQFKFAVSQNASDIQVGNIVVAPYPQVKKGWDYMWFETDPDDKDGSGGKKYAVAKMRAVHIEQVYNYRQFSLLGLPDV